MDTGAIIAIASIGFSLICSIIAFFLKRTINKVDRLDDCKASKEDLAAMEERVENRLNDHKSNIDEIKANYLTKEDFRLLRDDLIRAISGTDQKVERLIDFLMKKGGNGR